MDGISMLPPIFPVNSFPMTQPYGCWGVAMR
jgi:hypothetical protein